MRVLFIYTSALLFLMLLATKTMKEIENPDSVTPEPVIMDIFYKEVMQNYPTIPVTKGFIGQINVNETGVYAVSKKICNPKSDILLILNELDEDGCIDEPLIFKVKESIKYIKNNEGFITMDLKYETGKIMPFEIIVKPNMRKTVVKADVIIRYR